MERAHNDFKPKRSKRSGKKKVKLVNSNLEILRKFLHLKKLQIDVIHPYSKFKLCWDMIHSFLIIFLLFYIPLSPFYIFSV